MTFVPRWVLGSLDLTEYPFLSFPEDYGFPENVVEVVDSLLADGSIVSSDRTGNRTIPHTVWIEEADSQALAVAEASLIAECDRVRNTFTVEPGDGFGPATVFDTFRVQVQHVLNMDEERAGLRRYDLTIPALPYARSVDPVTESFTPGTAAYTNVNAASSLTGWTATGATISAVTHNGDGAIKVDDPSTAGFPGQGPNVRLTQAISAGDPYLTLSVQTDDYFPNTVRMVASNGGTYDPVALDGGRYFFPHPGAVSWVEFQFTTGRAADVYYLHAVESATNLPTASLFILDPVGSVRAPCSLHVSGSGLGETFVFTDPLMVSSGYQPGTSSTWAYLPEGAYQLWGKPGSAPAVGDVLSATAFGDQTVTVRAEAADLRWVCLGVVYAKPTRSGRMASFTVSANATSAASSAMAGNFQLFRTGTGAALTHARLTTENHLWIEAPSIDRPRGGLFAGSASDGLAAAAVSGSVSERDVHLLTPPLTAVYVKCVDETTPGLSETHFPHWHTHAGQ